MTRPSFRIALLALALAASLPVQAQDEILSLADQGRRAAWQGRIGDGLRLIEKHIAEHPDDRAARIDRARFLAWRSDYAGAIEALDALGGDDDEMRALRARIHAWLGRRDTALALNAPLFAAHPDDYDTAWTQALAARVGEWPHEALAPLATVTAIKPDARDTRDLAKAVRLPMFSWVGLPWTHSEDSDDIEIDTYGLDGSLRLSQRWRLTAFAQRRETSAPASGPFAPVTGGDRVDEDRGGIGLRLAVSPDTSLGAWVGASNMDPGDNETIGRVDLQQRATDSFHYGLRAERDRVGFSPLSLSLGVMRNTFATDLLWSPTLRDRISATLAYDDYSDGNERGGALLDYRHATVRNERIALDLGGQVEWSGYSDQPGNGYYSPERYWRVAPLATSYFPFGQDTGLYLQAALGVQRDETFDNWKRALDVGAEFTTGIYSRWQLAIRAGYSERLNEFGQYDGTSVGLELRYRFCDHRREECPAAAD